MLLIIILVVFCIISVPCAENLRIADVTVLSNGNTRVAESSYSYGSEVVLRRDGPSRRLSCINERAREKPSLKMYLQLPDSTTVPLPLYTTDSTTPVYPVRTLMYSPSL